MLRFLLCSLGLLLLACVLEQFSSPWPLLWGARFQPLLLTFLALALVTSTPAMLWFALLAGLLRDAQLHLAHPALDPLIFPHPLDNAPFGLSIILLAIPGFLLHGLRPQIQRANTLFYALLIGLGLLVFFLVELSVLSFLRGHLLLSEALLWQISTSAFLTILASPLLFWFLFHLADLFGVRLEIARKRPKRGWRR